jgi:hypothetical protein
VSSPSALGSTSLSRRAVLASVAVGLGGSLVACTTDEATGRGDVPQPASPEPPDPDLALAAEVRREEQDALDLIEATQQRHPDLTDALATAAEIHASHVALLADAADAGESAAPVVPGTSADGGGTGSPSPSGSPSAEATPRVPANRRRAVRQVVQQEQELATRGRQHAFQAQSGAFARVLASMAAAAAQQAVVLAEVAPGKETS